MNKLKHHKSLSGTTKYKNKTMGYLPLNFDTLYFDQFMSKYNSIHPYARAVVSYAMFFWQRKSDMVIENNVTKKFFEGDYSDTFFHTNLETIIRELKFTFTEGRPRNIVPTWLFLDMTEMTYSSMKETRISNTESISSSVVTKNNNQADILTSFSMTDMTFDRVNSIYPVSQLGQSASRYFPEGTLFDGTQVSQDRMIKMIPYNPTRANSQKTLLPKLKNFNEGNNFISLVFNDDAITGRQVPSDMIALGPEFINPSRFIRDLITIYSFYRKGTMSFTQPIYHNFPLPMWENIDLFNREVYSHSFKASIGDQLEVKKNSYIYEMFNDSSNAIVQDNAVSYGSGFKLNYASSLSRGYLKPMSFLITILEQAKDMMKWIETDQFPVEFKSNFDNSKILSNDDFIREQLSFMNSMGDTVQAQMINEKTQWQQEKDKMLAEIETKKKAIDQAVSEKRAMIKNIEVARSGKSSTLQNYTVELEKRYITE